MFRAFPHARRGLMPHYRSSARSPGPLQETEARPQSHRYRQSRWAEGAYFFGLLASINVSTAVAAACRAGAA